MNATVAETVEGAPHRRGARPRPATRRADRRRHRATPTPPSATRSTCARSLFPTVEIAYLLPMRSRSAGAAGSLRRLRVARRGDRGALYVQQLADPVDRLISWLDELQVGATSFARLLGVANVPTTATPPARSRSTSGCGRGRPLRLRAGRDVLHGVSTSIWSPASGSPSSGRPAPGKSTLGRLLAGIHRPAHRPGEVGGVRSSTSRSTTLRGEVALVTQEHHVFVGTLARQPPPRPARGAATTELRERARRRRRARLGCRRCPTASTPWSAPAATRCRRRRPSSSRSPGWCSPTRTRSCSTRRPR